MDTIKKNTEDITDASKGVGLEVHTEKRKYIIAVLCQQNAGQNYDIKKANRCFENVAQFRYDQNIKGLLLITEESLMCL
jgi:hypothetical protein